MVQREQVLKLIDGYTDLPGLTHSEIRAQTGIRHQTVYKILQGDKDTSGLVKDGLVVARMIGQEWHYWPKRTRRHGGGA